jgi:hypothetical protein
MAELAAGNCIPVTDITNVDDGSKGTQPVDLHASEGNHCHAIDIDIDVDDGSDGTQPLDQHAAEANHRHAIDINGGMIDHPPESIECAVCMERAEWVAVGPCGHREICSQCAVRIRLVEGNRRCCICRALCPTVIVTGAGGERHIHSKLAAASDGRVGKYWYHEASAAYFESKEQYRAAKRACSEQAAEEDIADENDDVDPSSPFRLFLVYLVINFFGGTMLCAGLAAADIHWGHKLAMLLGGGFGCAAIATIFWFLVDWFRGGQ